MRQFGPVVALESALSHDQLGQRSFVAGDPLLVAVHREGRWYWQRHRWLGALPSPAADPFRGLQELLDGLRVRFSCESDCPAGAFGFFGYECQQSEQAGERLQDVPDAWFLVTDSVVEWRREWPTPRVWSVDSELRDRLERRSSPARLAVEPTPTATRAHDWAREDFAGPFTTIRQHLESGNAYQVCLTYPIVRNTSADPMQLYSILRDRNPAPFAGLVEAGDFAVVSSSPERFLRVDQYGRVETRPMKGTARKAHDAADNRRIAVELIQSAKNRAENLMIADLLRNDLGRVCELGSVRVTESAKLEEYETVFQLSSQIEGQLETLRQVPELLHSVFPPGSMTGAPKIRAMQILRQLEPAARGPYSGALGYWTLHHQLDLSVVIRSLVLQGNTAVCGVGGGIVWDSTMEEEFQETRWKAHAMLQALQHATRWSRADMASQ